MAAIDPPPHPGDALRVLLEERGISQSAAARRLGLSRQHLNSIINGHNPVSSDLKLKLQSLLQVPADHWNEIRTKRERFEASPEGRALTHQQQQRRLLDQFDLAHRTTLVDHEIEQAVGAEWLGCHPFDDRQLSRTGFWLTLGLRGRVSRLDDPQQRDRDVVLKPGLKLQPGEVLSILSHERIRLPERLEAGIATEDDAFCTPELQLHCKRHFDSGLDSQLAFHIANHGARPQLLQHRQTAVLIQFHYLPEAPARDPGFS